MGRQRAWRRRILVGLAAAGWALGQVGAAGAASPANGPDPSGTGSGDSLVAAAASALAPSLAPYTDRARARVAYGALQQNLYLPAQQLYRGAGATQQFSFLWPFTNAMAGTGFLAGTPGGATYLSDVDARRSGLLEYRDVSEHSATGASQPPGFESAVPAPLGPGGDTYYDDNAWVTLDLLGQFGLTGDASVLQLAEQTFAFIETGWSSDPTAPCPGGVYWVDSSRSLQRNATSTAAAAEAAAGLYGATGNPSYLDWATRMYAWVNGCLAAPGGSGDSGLYYDHISANGTVEETVWSYNQGSMIGTGVLLYQATGDASYLQNATATAQAALAHFAVGTTLYSQGPAFDGIYLRNLFLLDQVAPDPAYGAEAAGYGSYMWDNERSLSTGLFSSTWGAGIAPTYDVNGTAAMVEIYSLLGGSAP